MIVNNELIKLLEINLLFKGVPKSTIDSFIKPKNFVIFEEGTFIYQTGDEALYLYLIVEGEVKIKFEGNRQITYKYLLDFFGEKAILENTRRTSVAIANKKSTIYQISVKELKHLLKQNNLINLNLTESNLSDSKVQQIESSPAQVAQSAEDI